MVFVPTVLKTVCLWCESPEWIHQPRHHRWRLMKGVVSRPKSLIVFTVFTIRHPNDSVWWSLMGTHWKSHTQLTSGVNTSPNTCSESPARSRANPENPPPCLARAFCHYAELFVTKPFHMQILWVWVLLIQPSTWHCVHTRVVQV